jgi:hypothetical protein
MLTASAAFALLGVGSLAYSMRLNHAATIKQKEAIMS